MRDEEIKVLGRDEPFRFTVRSTRHGPLLSDVDDGLSTVGANAPVGARRAAARQRLRRLDLLDGAEPEQHRRRALRVRRGDELAGVPRRGPRLRGALAEPRVRRPRGQHRLPGARDASRSARRGRNGDYPARGWRPADDWTGKYVPFQALPNVLNPSDGYFATANQAVTRQDYPYFLGDSWEPGYRSQRIADLLREQGEAQRRGHVEHPARHPQRVRADVRALPAAGLHAVAVPRRRASGCCRAGTSTCARARRRPPTTTRSGG